MILLVLSAQTARAEEYVFEAGNNNKISEAQDVENPEVKQFVYGILGPGFDTADYYSLNFADYSPQVKIELLVSAKTTYQDFHPTLILFDPTVKHMQGGTLPFGMPLNRGGRILAWPKYGEDKLTDSVVWEDFRVGPQVIKDFSPNRYTLAVYDPAGRGGKYVLHTGGLKSSESFFTKLKIIPAFIRIKLSLY